MTVDGGLNPPVHSELSDRVISRSPCMMKAVAAVGSIINTVPVIQIEIVKHGSGDQYPSVSAKTEPFVQAITCFRNTPAVLER